MAHHKNKSLTKNTVEITVSVPLLKQRRLWPVPPNFCGISVWTSDVPLPVEWAIRPVDIFSRHVRWCVRITSLGETVRSVRFFARISQVLFFFWTAGLRVSVRTVFLCQVRRYSEHEYEGDKEEEVVLVGGEGIGGWSSGCGQKWYVEFVWGYQHFYY